MVNTRLKFIIDIAFFALIIGLFVLALKYLLPLIMPFLIAFLIAAVLQPIIRTISERISFLPRKLWAGLIVFLFYTTIGFLSVLVILWLLGQLFGFVGLLTGYISDLARAFQSATRQDIAQFFDFLPDIVSESFIDFFFELSRDLPNRLLEIANQFSDQILSSIGEIGSGTLSTMLRVIIGIPGVLITVIVAVIASFFIGIDYEHIVSSFTRLFPERARPILSKIRMYSKDTVLNLLKTYFLLMVITFSELAVGLSLINLVGRSLGFNISYVITLALLISVVDILPVLGVGAVLLPWALFNFVGGSWQLGLLLVLLYLIITIVRNYLEPKIIGQKYGFHPIVMLIAIYVGGSMFGIIGVLLLPLILIIVKRLESVGAIRLVRE